MAEVIVIGCPLAKELEDAAHTLKKGPSNAEETAYAALLLNGLDRTGLLDSLADQIVTAIGVGHMFGMDVLGALAEVDRSNWSKFVDGKPQFDANGKIAKPATYSPPDLARFI